MTGVQTCALPIYAKKASYVGNGKVVLPDIDGSGTKELRVPLPLPDGNETPPGGWQFNGLPKGIMHPAAAVQMVRQQHPEWTKDQAWKELMAFNLERIPEFFDKQSLDSSFRKYRLAMQNAGYLI